MVDLRVIDHHIAIRMLVEIDERSSSLLGLSFLPFSSLRECLIVCLRGCSWIEVGVGISDRVARAVRRFV